MEFGVEFLNGEAYGVSLSLEFAILGCSEMECMLRDSFMSAGKYVIGNVYIFTIAGSTCKRA